MVQGVLLRVHGVGVLLTGASGSGKSALALELITRGHALVADDVVEIAPSARGLVGTAPRSLSGRLAVRQMGILDIGALYGAAALRRSQRLDLVVRLTRRRPLAPTALIRGRRSWQRVLGRSLPRLSLSTDVGHNLPTLVEAACLQQRQQ